MRHYVHDIPGRLRIRNPLFKNEDNHQQVRLALSVLTGIKGSEFKKTTGSLTVTYDPDAIDGKNIMGALERAGYFDSTKAITNDEYVHNIVSRTGSLVSRALFGSALDVALEGTGFGWLGFLL